MSIEAVCDANEPARNESALTQVQQCYYNKVDQALSDEKSKPAGPQAFPPKLDSFDKREDGNEKVENEGRNESSNVEVASRSGRGSS